MHLKRTVGARPGGSPPARHPQAGSKLENAETEYRNLQEKRSIVENDRSCIEQVRRVRVGDRVRALVWVR